MQGGGSVRFLRQPWQAGDFKHSIIVRSRTEFSADPLEPTARLFLVRQVLVITHEKARMEDQSDYFANKFHPLRVMYVIGRSYTAAPKCKPKETLFDAWNDRLD